MVYRGKLSKACAECRSRKTRCDAARPACAQCKRASRVCSGYQETKSLRILNQTQSVVTGARKKRACGGQLALASQFPEQGYILSSTASCVFYEEYNNPNAGFADYDYDFVSPMRWHVKSDDLLASMVASLGFIFIARKSSDRSFIMAAARHYSRVLKISAARLCDVDSAKSDEMLATVWLLSLHESIALGGFRNSPHRSAHLLGAAKLLQLRGEEQFNTAIGRGMFLRVAGRIVLNCLDCGATVPRDLRDLMRHGWNYYHIEARSELALLSMASELCDLIAVEPQVVKTAQRDILKSLLSLDDRLLMWPSTISERYAIYRKSFNVPVDLDYYDLYSCHVSAAIWNFFRKIRIVTNQHIIRYARLNADLTGQETVSSQKRAIQTIKKMSEDICYSVPFLITRDMNADQDPEIQNNKPTIYGGSCVIVPLSLAAKERRVSPEMHNWMICQIENISRDTGIGLGR